MLKRSLFLLACTKGNSGFNSELQHVPLSSVGAERMVHGHSIAKWDKLQSDRKCLHTVLQQ